MPCEQYCSYNKKGELLFLCDPCQLEECDKKRAIETAKIPSHKKIILENVGWLLENGPEDISKLYTDIQAQLNLNIESSLPPKRLFTGKGVFDVE